MKNILFILIIFILISCSANEERNRLYDIKFPKEFEKSELGIEYSKLRMIYNCDNIINFDSLKLQADKVFGLLKSKEPQHAKIINFVALCFRVTNMDYANTKDSYNKEKIIDLYQRAYQIGVINNLQDTKTFRETLFQLAECLEQNSQNRDALKYRQEYYRLSSKSFGDKSDRTADALMWIGNNYLQQNLADSAIFYFNKEIDIRKKLEDTEIVNQRLLEINKLKSN